MVGKVAGLLNENGSNLAAFFTSDPRGKQLPGYLQTLADHLGVERVDSLRELDALRKNIEHIKEIVAMQQTYARVSGVTETVGVVELVEDAIHMNAGALLRHRVTLVRDFQTQRVITVEKHKVLQILVNFIRNAKYACDESGRADKQITVRVAEANARVEIAVIDNGIGIAPENLTRIFGHGFTTRKDGHGFGLHSGALAAKELGGEISVHSDGPGRGATFILKLSPLTPFTS
jgi:C4-dicarboxylate-specific signal transduction histidine kinase